MIQINPLQRYIDGGARAAITTPPSASLVFDLPGRAIWVKGVKLKGTDHTYTFSHDNYISLTNTPGSNESEDILIGINTTLLKQAIDTTYGIVNATTNGLAPMFSSANKATAAAATTYNFLGIAGTTLKWYSLPWRNVRINAETSDKLGVNDTDPLIISQGTGISVTWDSSGKKIVITNTAPDVNHNTDSSVAQTRTVLNKDYPLILKGSADSTGIIAGVNFNESITYNPSTSRLLINSQKVITIADVYVGATASAAATSGLVPAATSAQRTYFLRGDGTWTTPQDYNTWRPIKVNSSEKLGSGTDTGAVDFVAGTGITLGWDATNKKITITNSAPDQNHNTDRTGIKLGNVSGNKKADGTVILANSASGLIIAGGTNKFSIGDGTNYIEVPITISHGLSTKNITINGTAYAIYTSASSLPTFVAPGSYAGTGGYILATNSAKNGLEWVAKPTSNVTTTAIVGNSASATSQITAAQTNPYYNLLEGGAVTRSIRFVAGNGITISAATDGLITITNSKPDVNHDTHYVTTMYIGESNDTKSNVVATNPYLKLFDNDTRRSTLRFVAGNGITIGSDASGNITITNSKPDVNHDTHYTTTMFAGENNNTKANKVATNPYLKLFDNDTRRSTLRFVAGTGITIASDANGNITVTNASPDVNHNTDRTGLKKGAAGSTAASGLVIANSASGLIMEGGDKQFKVGDGTNAFTISFTVSSLDIIRSINGDTHAKALLTEFTNNKSSIPRNKLINYYSSAYGNGSQYFGYFLSGYDSNPYGGFFVAHYNACYYVGISNGTFTQWELSKVGHKHAYTDLTGSGTTANLAILSNGTANGWKLATVSLSDHTHPLSIAADSGTSSITLAASTKYKLTAGGSTYVFTSTPDENVKQTNNDNNQDSPILLKNGTGTGNITSGAIFADGVTVNPSTNSLKVSGSNSYFLAIRGHRLGYRHLDAGPKSSWSDSRLYIGYNGFSDDDGVTDSIGFYRSTGTGTYTRTLWAEINSNGLYANTRFGVNGQNTGYNFYVNGTSFLNNTVRIQYNTPNLYIRNTVDTSYSIIRLGTNSNENASYIFQNGPSRTDDGGANTMTIRNNVGVLRLQNRIHIDSTGRVYPEGTDSRRAGMYGVYDSYKIGHIWSMGTAYMIPDNGANFGNLYGLAYKHTNNTTGGAMGGGHQMVWCANGTPFAAMGEAGIWSRQWLHVNGINSGTDNGITLYNREACYGIMFRQTSNLGTHGYVSGDWATYFTMSDSNNRGWVFRRWGNKNVASISTDGNAYFNGHIRASSHPSSWLDGQRYDYGGYNLLDANDTGSYWPWMRQTNTGSSKWFSMGVLNNSLYIIGSATSRTANSYDYGWRFDVSNGWAYGNFLNSDTLDGIHANGLLTAASLGASGNSTTLSVTVGGTTKTGSVTVPYATLTGTVTVNNSDANSTYRMVWHSGNTLYSTGGIYCNPYTDTLYATRIIASYGNFVQTSMRHIDAGLNSVHTDHGLYIGYGAQTYTAVTHFYYSTGSTDSTSSRTEFMQINSNGAYALTRFGVNGQNTSYNLHVNGTGHITGRLYEDEWIQFSGKTGLYWPNSGSGTHFLPANDCSYGSFLMNGSKNSYCGITAGPNNNYPTFMGHTTHLGLYNASTGLWILYYNRDNGRIGLRTSSLTGYATTNEGDFYCRSGWLRTDGARGWYNESYGGGWYMEDSTWIRSYGSKPLHLAGSTYAYGAGGHYLAIDCYLASHTSIGLRNSACGWYLCSNSNRNFYLGYRNNSSASSTSGDTYPVYIEPAGNIYATHYYEKSDIRLKHDISMISKSIRKFKFNNDDKLYYGFIAQELETLHPELVNSSSEYKTVNYNSAICYYIAELENKVQKLEDEINKLKNK